MRIIAVLAIALIGGGVGELFLGTAWGEEIRLGGVRAVTVEVSSNGDTHELTVRFVAVTSFSEAFDERVNNAKARQYSLRALARHLNKKPPIRLSVSGMKIVRKSQDGKFITVTFQVPFEGVTFHQITEPSDGRGTAIGSVEKPSTVGVLGALNLLSRKSDYLETLNELSEMLHSDLALVAENEAVDSIWERLIALNRSADNAFCEIISQVDADRLLLNHERGQIKERIATECERFLGDLADAEERLVLRGKEF